MSTRKSMKRLREMEQRRNAHVPPHMGPYPQCGTVQGAWSHRKYGTRRPMCRACQEEINHYERERRRKNKCERAAREMQGEGPSTD